MKQKERHKMSRLYLLYDGRACNMDTDDATVCSVSNSLEEAKSDKDKFFPDGIIFSYQKNGSRIPLSNRRFEE